MKHHTRAQRIHEAGHAVAAHKLGVKVVDLDMAADADRGCCHSGTWPGPAWPDDQAALERAFYADIMVNMAGIAVQKLAGFPTNDDDFNNGDDGDINRAFQYADFLTRLKAGLSLSPGPGEPDDPPYDPDDDDIELDQWRYDNHRRHLKTGSPLQLDRRSEPHELHIASSAIVGHAEEEITALLIANWPAIERVTDALAKRDHLTAAELDRLIASGQ